MTRAKAKVDIYYLDTDGNRVKFYNANTGEFTERVAKVKGDTFEILGTKENKVLVKFVKYPETVFIPIEDLEILPDTDPGKGE